MGLLDNFEQRLDQMVNQPFQRAFKGVVEPVEVASRIQREMDTRAAIISRGRTVVPNAFTVDLSSDDYERLADITGPISAELVGMAREYGEEQRYTFLGAVTVEIGEDPTLDTGVFRVHSQTKADAHPPQAAAPVAAAPAAVAHARLVVGTRSYPLTKSRTRIGRGPGADLDLKDDPAVSRSHAEILLGIPTVVRDLGSANGTSVDGRKVSEAPLHDGAQLKVGSTVLTFRSG